MNMDQSLNGDDHRLFAHEGPVRLDEAMVLEDGQSGIRTLLQRYSADMVDALLGSDSRGFALGLLGPWGSGKTSAMLALLDLVEERLRTKLPGNLEIKFRPSPQEPLAGAIQVTDASGQPHFPVTSSVLRAPLSIRNDRTDDARVALAYAILWGLPPVMQSSIAEWLGYKPSINGVQSPAQRLEIEQFLREELRRRAFTGTEIEQWIRDARSTFLASEASSGKAVFLRKNIHLTMLDDLDRAPLSYTAQILNAMRFWVDTEGMFFIVAATSDYLSDAARLANTTGVDHEVPDQPRQGAVQKFVHHELNMPDLFSIPVDVARYWLQLLAAPRVSAADGEPANTGLNLLRDALNSFVEAPSTNPLGVLTPLLSPWVVDLARSVTPIPREAKRHYNALVGEVSALVETAGLDELKRNVASLAWRDAWLQFVHPALTAESQGQPGPKVIALRTALDLAGRALSASSDDVPAAVFRLEQLAREARLDLTGIPSTLLLYLAADPPLRAPTVTTGFDVPPRGIGRESVSGKPEYSSAQSDLFGPSHPAGTEKQMDGADEDRSASTYDFALRDTRGEAEASTMAENLYNAARGGDIRRTWELSEALVPLLGGLSNTTVLGEIAVNVGNAAIRVESQDARLAWNLHRLAHSLDSDQSNIRLNLSEFLLDYAQGEDALTEVEHQLDWIAANEPGFRSDRQTALRARLALAKGDDAGFREIVDNYIDRVMSSAASFDDVATALTLLNQIRDRERMESVVHDRLNLHLADDQGDKTYRLLRTLGDALIADEGEVEGRGVDILRHLLGTAFCPDITSVAAVLNNLAIIYEHRGGPAFEQLAGMLWRIALEFDPSDTTIRQAYSRYLSRRDAEASRRLQLGQMPTISVPGAGDVQRLVSTLPAHLSSGPWWWEEFTPPEARYGFEELAILPGPEPPAPPA